GARRHDPWHRPLRRTAGGATVRTRRQPAHRAPRRPRGGRRRCVDPNGKGDMTMAQGIVLTRNGAILEIRLDRPKANAIDLAASRALNDAFGAYRDDPELRVAIITGTGEKFFSAGWDLKAAAGGEATDSD